MPPTRTASELAQEMANLLLRSNASMSDCVYIASVAMAVGAVRISDGNLKKAARLLGLSRSDLALQLRQWSLDTVVEEARRISSAQLKFDFFPTAMHRKKAISASFPRKAVEAAS